MTAALLIAAPFVGLALLVVVAAWGPRPVPARVSRATSSNRKAGRGRADR